MTQGLITLAAWCCIVAAHSSLATFGSDSPQDVSTTSPNRGMTRDALLFQNGDLLYGALESINSDLNVRWRHFDVDQPIEFAPTHLSEIHFPTHPVVLTNSIGNCRLRLNNLDEVSGELVRFDQDKAVLRTWYAGEITVPHTRIQSVIPVPPEGAVLYEGPTGLDGWTIGKVSSSIGDAGEWQYSNGAFYATNAASIARKVSMPDVATVEFDLAWKGIFQLAIAIYTDYMQPINLANKDTEPNFGGFYSLQLNSFSANVLPVKKNDPLRYLGQVSVPAFNQKNRAHVIIRASKPKKTLWLYVDGQLIKEWVDTEDFAGQGSGLRFVHQGQGKVKLSHLRVSEWDGQLEEKAAYNLLSTFDLAKLRNGDRAQGTVESIQDGKVTLLASGTRLSIPLTRVKQIELAGQKLERPAPGKEDVRATFARGGAVTFHLEKWETNQVLGSSSSFGHLSFKPNAFSRLELHPSPTAASEK